MNMFITVTLLCSLAISAIAQGGPGGGRGGPGGGRGGPGGGRGGPPGGRGGPGGPPGGGPPGGPGGPKGPRGPPPSMYDMFPACKTMAESMREKHRELKDSGEIGPRNCQEEDRKVCMQRDMKKVRCAVSEEPQEQCIKEMMDYIQGDSCDGEGGEAGGDPFDPTENEDDL